MRVVFRADASLAAGSGHVMRCLTLAGALRAAGADCHFLCREHSGHLIGHVRRAGFDCTALAAPANAPAADDWLGTTPAADAAECRPLLQRLRPDWLVVDHYALDASWESALRDTCRRLLVIDDLANRPHDCDLLLDQNLGRAVDAYDSLVPTGCQRLIGSAYALLRPEFAAQRPASLARRAGAPLRHLLVSMGGVDLDNATAVVLAALAPGALPPEARVTVVMGAQAPWRDAVRALAATLPWPVAVQTDVRDMAALLADADLVIGAAGSSAWERCCLGVPTLLVVLAANQAPIAAALDAAGAGRLLGTPATIPSALPPALAAAHNPGWLATASARARALCDGRGADRVVARMEESHA